MKRFPWRAALYVVVVGYLILDLKVFHGPLRDAMRTRRDAAVVEARSRGWVALVNQEPLTREQVEVGVERHLWQRGRNKTEVPEKNLGVIRRAVLNSLIDETLVRQHAEGDPVEVSPEEVAAFVASWKSRFVSPEDLAERVARQGLDADALDAELARIWSRKRWLERRIAPGVQVEEEEGRSWFEENRRAADGSWREGFVDPEGAPLSYETLRPEIVSLLEAQRAEETVTLLMAKLRKVANLHVFLENL